MNRLILLDGNALLHRAYHAIPSLTAPDGKVVNAVYGFAAIVFRLVTDLRPTHLAVAFDRPAPTFRKQMYKEYQATRPEMDEALVGQIDLVHELVVALRIPIFEMDGFEADDVIGTICQKVQNPNTQAIDKIIIVTGDRDILQLVEDERVLVYMPTKGLSEAKMYTEKEVIERMGVLPKQIVELKALMGDSSDNYPGVSGIGPKTAVGLISAFGSVENIFEYLNGKGKSELAIANYGKSQGSFSAKVVEKLRAGEEAARLSKNLATIRQDVPIEMDPEKLTLGHLDTPEVREFLERLHFHSLIKRLGKMGTNSEEAAKKRPVSASAAGKSSQQSLF